MHRPFWLLGRKFKFVDAVLFKQAQELVNVCGCCCCHGVSGHESQDSLDAYLALRWEIAFGAPRFCIFNAEPDDFFRAVFVVVSFVQSDWPDTFSFGVAAILYKNSNCSAFHVVVSNWFERFSGSKLLKYLVYFFCCFFRGNFPDTS